MVVDPLKHIEDVAKETNSFMEKKTKGVFNRYPITFSFLILFGVVAILQGFDSVISYIPYLKDHPAILFGVGVIVLLFTGSLYNRLDKKIK